MLIERLLKVALLGSAWVLYLLLFLSVVSIATMVERWLYFRKHRVNNQELHRQLAKFLDADDLEGAAKFLEKNPSLEARVAREALRWAPSGPESMNDAVDSELARGKAELERGLNLLGTLGNNAPFVGLLGTVIGIIGAFRQLDVSGGQLTAGLMAEIGEALATTALGLLVALPAVAAYNGFQRAIQVRLNRGDARGREVVAKLHARAHASSLPQAAS